jgi:hypothetical protein
MESSFYLAQQEALNNEMTFDASIYRFSPLVGLFPFSLALDHRA